MNHTPQASVIVCTHNPRPEYLQRTLAALGAQTLPTGCWELILVDNASDEAIAPRFPLHWHPRARHVAEPTLGLAAARFRGIDLARAGILVFVDDDNVLAPDYLAQALEIAATMPFIGAWGGRIAAEFEVEPEAWSRPYLPLLALRDFARDQWSNRVDNLETAPCGAGLCVRTAIARRYQRAAVYSPLRRGLGRIGASLSSGEDSDLALTACSAGSGTGIFTRLQLTHLIPRERLSLAYLTRLAEGIMRSYTLVMSLHQPVARPRFSRVEGWFRAYRRLRLSAQARAMEDAMERGRQSAYDLLGL